MNNKSSDYLVFQNPNHNKLPDYSDVLKKNKKTNFGSNNKGNKNPGHSVEHEDEENIFNLGKEDYQSNNRNYENVHKNSGEKENLNNENNYLRENVDDFNIGKNFFLFSDKF